MLDSFDSINSENYIAGFPMHPHRGIETISYVFSGKIMHRDSLGNEDTVSSGEVQWMNSGSGILHEERIPDANRLLAGDYKDVNGYRGKNLPLNYYDIHLDEGVEITLNMDENESVMLFTLLGDVYVEGEFIEEKTAIKLTEGDSVSIKNGDEKAQVLYISSKALNEPISWAGPIVMNSKEEIKKALDDLNKGIFIK